MITYNNEQGSDFIMSKRYKNLKNACLNKILQKIASNCMNFFILTIVLMVTITTTESMSS